MGNHRCFCGASFETQSFLENHQLRCQIYQMDKQEWEKVTKSGLDKDSFAVVNCNRTGASGCG